MTRPNYPPVERCLGCGVFFLVPAVEQHTAEECTANRARQVLPTREPGHAKLPNQKVKSEAR